MKNWIATILLFGILLSINSWKALCAETLPVLSNIGGKFHAQSTLGRPVASNDLHGKLVVLYFGYSKCLDLCPQMTAGLAKAVKDLGIKSQQVQVVMVGIDTKHETVATMKKFLASFNPNFIGLVDKEVVIRKIAKAYKVDYFQSRPMGKNRHAMQDTNLLQIGHGDEIFVVDQQGQTRKLVHNAFQPGELNQILTDLGL